MKNSFTAAEWAAAQDETHRRREQRHQVQMLAHFHYRATRSTVMLKDLTCSGARIEGVAALERDEAVSLILPGCRPMLAFVAWASGTCAGLEFAAPLEADNFGALVAAHAVGQAPGGPPPRQFAA